MSRLSFLPWPATPSSSSRILGLHPAPLTGSSMKLHTSARKMDSSRKASEAASGSSGGSSKRE